MPTTLIATIAFVELDLLLYVILRAMLRVGLDWVNKLVRDKSNLEYVIYKNDVLKTAI